MSKTSLLQGMSPAQRREFGERLRACVDSIGTQVEAAAIAGLSADQIGRYAKGRSAPSLFVAERLTRASGFNLQWLATGKGPARPPSKAFVTEEHENDRAKLIALVNELETERDALRHALGNVLIERALAEVPRG